MHECLFYRLHTVDCASAICFEVKKSAQKIRADQLLVERGLAPSRERAQALLIAGKVLVAEQKIVKPGTAVESTAEIRLLGEDLKYVSRGGVKLERALEHWNIDVRGKTCMDVGASTGGFTDCLLQHGATRVIAVDTGHGEIHRVGRVDYSIAEVVLYGGCIAHRRADLRACCGRRERELGCRAGSNG